MDVNTGDSGDGVTPNDNLDADSGPNDLQNFPVLKAAQFNPDTHLTTVTGSLNSLAQNAYEIDFYDTNGGETFFVGSSINVLTDVNGNARFSATLPQGFAVGSGDTVSATATRIFNAALAGTSEFSAGVVGQNVPSLSINNTQITAGTSGTKNMTFTVSLSGVNPAGAGVQFATTDGSALAGTDYVAKSGTLTWAAGDTSPKTFNVVINGDPTVDDPEEFLFINLTNAVGATITGSAPQGSGDILNGTTGVAISDVTATEGNLGTKTFNFTVSRTGLTTGATSVKFATANGTTNPATAGSDYVAKTGTLTWAANDTTDKTLSITVNGDTTVEKDETFFVNLSSPAGATIIDGQGLGTIQNDDTSIAISDALDHRRQQRHENVELQGHTIRIAHWRQQREIHHRERNDEPRHGRQRLRCQERNAFVGRQRHRQQDDQHYDQRRHDRRGERDVLREPQRGDRRDPC